MLRMVPSAVVTMDLTGTITMLNRAAERLLSTTASAAVGHLYTEVFGPSLANRMVPLLLRCYRSHDQGSAHVFPVTLPDGRQTTIRASLGLLHGAQHEVIGSFFAAEEQTTVSERLPTGSQGGEMRLRDLLARYVGAKVASQLDRPSFVGVGGKRMTLSVLHADIRGYTNLAEERSPEAVMDLLLRFHGAAVEALQATGATIDRYIGDALLAFWNAPIPQADHVQLAIRGAQAVQSATRNLEATVGYGIGLHTGEAVVGNLGSEQYMHYTAIGDTVNVAARLQTLAGHGEIVCSAAVISESGLALRTIAMPKQVLKGRSHPIDAFRIEEVVA